ncbi:MAG: hypothetical protein KIT39_02935, partial [Nitrospirales bacterium]|nr:hypothetical protein [Nitrospirales bacterium]
VLHRNGCVHQSYDTIRKFEGTVKQILVRVTIFLSGDQYFALFIAWPYSQSPIILRRGHAFKKTRTSLPPTSLRTKKSDVFSSNHVSLYAMVMKRSYDQRLISLLSQSGETNCLDTSACPFGK